MLDKEDFENATLYREYVLAEFKKYWQKLSVDDWWIIMTETMYTDDLAQVVQACEEY